MLRTLFTTKKNFRTAVAGINDAIDRALISAKGYDKVGVLSLRWENDDMGLYDIEQELLDVFKTIFHYDTDAFLIPAKSTRDAALATRDRLQDFVNKYDGPASLLIVIYQGHSQSYKIGACLYPFIMLKICM